MNRRDFLRSIGAAVLLPGALGAVPMARGGIVKGFATHGPIPVILGGDRIEEIGLLTNPAEILKDLTKRAIEAQGLDLEIDEDSFQEMIDYCEVKK